MEKDLGVHVDSHLNYAQHICQAKNKGNMLLAVIRRTYEYLDEESLMLLYKGLVRPAVEYGVVVWAPRLPRDIEAIESVQRRATRLVPGLKELSYPDRLRRIKLPTLSYRRHRGDMIHTYKYACSIYQLPETSNILPRAQFLSTRGHPLKLAKIRCRTLASGAFFSQRVVSLWNSLPEDVLSAPSINAFKNRLDKHWHNVAFRYDFKAVATPVSYRNTTVDMRSGQ